jgi:transposase
MARVPQRRRLRLARQQRKALAALVRGQRVEYRTGLRARIILMLAAGTPVAEVARRLSTTRVTVRQWRDRFLASGDLDDLCDLPRSGRPSQVPIEVRLELVKLACIRPDEKRMRFRDTWTYKSLRVALRRETGHTLSVSEIGRILRAEGMRPHRVSLWLHSPDPKFRPKVRRICRLYTSPPKGATVLCVDEKTCIQALGRRFPMRPSKPGCPNRFEFEYVRRGTRTLIGAFDIRTGEVFAHVRSRRTAADLLAFMEDLARRYPTGDVYIVWDNLNIHSGTEWTRFNRRHGNRFHFVYTPIHASWVNQIEIWFGILQRRVIRFGDFRTPAELERRLLSFIGHWNRFEAHPFRWTFRGRFDQHQRPRLAA